MNGKKKLNNNNKVFFPIFIFPWFVFTIIIINWLNIDFIIIIQMWFFPRKIYSIKLMKIILKFLFCFVFVYKTKKFKILEIFHPDIYEGIMKFLSFCLSVCWCWCCFFFLMLMLLLFLLCWCFFLYFPCSFFSLVFSIVWFFKQINSLHLSDN